MSVQFVLAHGWGFGPDFWSPLRKGLDCALGSRNPQYGLVDLGFFGPGHLPEPPQHGRPRVAVGHSLGFLWLLRHMAQHVDALVSLGGFARFDVPAGPIRAMRRGLGRNASGVLHAFHEACALPGPLRPAASQARPERLSQGLDWLLEWDASQALHAWSGPLLAVACEDDAIVPAGLSRRCFSHALTMLPKGGHAFAATKAGECARLIACFVENL